MFRNLLKKLLLHKAIIKFINRKISKDVDRLRREVHVLRLNAKNLGYEIAQEQHQKLLNVNISGEPENHHLVSKATTQRDMESSWFAYWCQQIKAAPIYHRKLWEFAFLLQGLHDQAVLREGARGIGFGCGKEPLASYFASQGMQVTVTDLSPEDSASQGWVKTNQHATAKTLAYHPKIVDEATFERNVSHQYIDMNHLPDFEQQYDFCWSVCAMEHLGTIQQGLAFVENSLAALKPGGVAIHTTEFNYLYDEETLDNRRTVLFRKRDILELQQRLKQSGANLLGPDFDIGSGVLDKYIDVPPYKPGNGMMPKEHWQNRKHSAHLKLALNGFPCTCFGLIIVKS